MENKKIVKIGIFGLWRGSDFIESILANNAEIVALCDMNKEKLEEVGKRLGGEPACYESFDDFVNHPMDAVLLANYCHEHAPFAIRLLEKDISVISECLTNVTMAEGVALARAVRKSKGFYMLSENYPYMLFNQEIRRVYQGGTLGKVLFAEGQYNHPFNPTLVDYVNRLTPDLKHWRNFLPRSYYITHSLAPLMYATGSNPVRVTAMPVFAPKEGSASYVGDQAAIITTLNDDNSVFNVTGCAAFGAHGNSYRLCCEKGQIENIRGMGNRVMLRYNPWQVPEGEKENNCYVPVLNDPDADWIYKAGHGGGDFFIIRKFIECVRNGETPDMDVYFGTRMSSVAILAHRSLLEGGVPYDIPDFSKEEDCVKWENDDLTPFYHSDGREPTIPCCSKPDYLPTEEAKAAFNKSRGR